MPIDIGDEFTTISKHEMERLRSQSFSTEEVVEYLQTGIKLRSFGDTLRRFAGGMDDKQLREELKEALSSYPGAPSPESIDRNIRNWLGDKYQPNKRADLIKLCFALKLDEGAAQEFLSMTSMGGFHRRNPEELAFLFALRIGETYGYATELIAKVREKLAGLNMAGHEASDEGNNKLSQQVADAFNEVDSEENFLRFIAEYSDKFGSLHNMAYSEFKNYLNALKDPGIHYDQTLKMPDEEKITVREIIRQYLNMGVPEHAPSGSQTALQRTLRAYWPNETSISRMLSHSEDVTRKTLMLLFIVTGGTLSDEPDSEIEDVDEPSAMAVFEDRYLRLKSLLHECGYALPDPRNVFDWLVLYSLLVEEDTDKVICVKEEKSGADTRASDRFELRLKPELNERMEPVLKQIFSNVAASQSDD